MSPEKYLYQWTCQCARSTQNLSGDNFHSYKGLKKAMLYEELKDMAKFAVWGYDAMRYVCKCLRS